MPITSPNNLWSPDPTDPYNLTLHLAQMQTSVQAALNTKQDTLTQIAWTQNDFTAGSNSVNGAVRYTREGRVVNVRLVILASNTIPAGVTTISNYNLPVAVRPDYSARPELLAVGETRVEFARISEAGVITVHNTGSSISGQNMVANFTYMTA